MGLGFSQEGQVQQIYEFRKLTSDPQNFEIPERPENRRVTDRKWFIVFAIFIIVLIPFVIYTLAYTEWKQLFGYDNCGNFCGYKNKKYDEWACTGKDYTEQKYVHFIKNIMENNVVIRERECVSECPPGTEVIFTTCQQKTGNRKNSELPEGWMESFFALWGQVLHDVGRGWWAILLSAVVSCLFCLGVMCLFRWAVAFVVWFILIGSIGILAILAGLFWYAYFYFEDHKEYRTGNDENKGAKAFLIMAIIFSVMASVLLIMVTCMVKRVKLIIALFKEASKAIFGIPSMIVIPVYTSILVTLTMFTFLVLTFFMSVAGKLTEIAPNYLDYSHNSVMIMAMIYNFLGFIWFGEFIVAAQYIIIAGAVSAWFFTRNKEYLDSPLWASFTNFIRFHLGTVALGSLIITAMSIIRGIIKGLADNPRTKWLIDCCLSNVEEFIRFLSKNAYIETAMHGQPFFKSGKRAAKLLVSNASNVIAINTMGDFVLNIAQLILILVSTTAGVFIAKTTGLTHYWAVALCCFIIALCISATFFAIFEATIDCIFICFCEDTTLNDGMARPYFMSKGLMQFIEDSKTLLPKKK